MAKRTNTPQISMESLSRMNLRDMLVLPDTVSQVTADLSRFYAVAPEERAGLEATSIESIEAAYGFSPQDDEDRKPFVYQDGVAVIPIHGTLLNRCSYSWGFVTGYQGVRRMMNAALDDDDVELIVFDVDSPGGEAAGCFELAREIMASRRVKPSLAMVDALAASGGIALASCATTVYAIPSARVGSIGVYRMHVSYEDSLKADGIKVTFATAGDNKIDGNPYQDLPKAVLDEWRESAGKTWDDFIALVAEARGMPEDDVRATQARIYRADEALDIGLINAVKTPTEAVAAFLAELAEADPSTEDDEEITMADPKPKEVTSILTDADMARIVEAAASAGAAAASKVADNIARKDTIKEHAATKGPAAAALAATLIANANLSADDAITMLDAAFGKEAASAPKPKKGKAVVVQGGDEGEGDEGEGDEGEGDEDEGESEGDEGEGDEEAARSSRSGRDKVNHFDRAMKGAKQPKVGGGSVKGGNDGRPAANPLLADHAAVTGADWSRKGVTEAKH